MENNSHPVWLPSLLQHLDSRSLEGYEIFYQKQKKFSVESRDLTIDSLQSSEDHTLAIRLSKNKCLGFSFASQATLESALKAAETAETIARVREPEAFEIFPPLKLLSLAQAHSKSHASFYDEGAVSSLSPEKKIKSAIELERLATQYDPRVKSARNAQFSDRSSETAIYRHDLPDGITSRKSVFSASVACLAEKDGQSQLGGYGRSVLHLKDLPQLEEIAERASADATLLLGAETLKGALSVPAVFKYDAVADLIEFMAASFSGEALEKARSLFSGKLNEKIFSPSFTLRDEPLHPAGVASRLFDGEGVTSSATALIENGVFKSFISDYHVSQKLKLPHTGHSARAGTAPPKISCSNLVLSCGKSSLAKLFTASHNGVYITQLMGVHTANPVTGAFSLGAAGLKIENGVLTTPVQGFAVAGNIFDLFKKIKELGSDQTWTGSVLCPSILFDDMSISGT